ncbi:chemoreceptor glutamine deamidase CheD [Thioflexithrix psekupsensis]|uniref:Probable chemoreceptor glutamine deamidase CheD n=1 Tax=Thioflexithrix psekupsensis TaxID=1570016 RepID=A0A251X3Y6_9GAMM|nr:chemoreceptor glutamine deamidase CheD [Thioflexithrix psekupsensis]OUD11644.1 chemotaxis protein CheD [Thioflexithrix psekupsensis]
MQKPPTSFKGYEHIKRYWDHHYDSYVAKILPGEYYVTRQDEIITTVVGSCVSACICDSQNGIGGMNHFMLPTRTIPPDKWDKTAVSAATRYGNYAMEHVINEILKYGGRRENLQLKLFGGGRIMQYMANIGQQNIDFIRNYVRTEGLKLMAEDLGDIYPRKILFYPLTGRVRVKKLRAMEQGIIERENAYLRNLETHPIDGGEVDLF